MPSIDLPLVMIWRRVSNLKSAKAVAEGMLHLVAIGQDDDSLMYDAGSVILGLCGQSEFRQVQEANAASLVGADAVALHSAARNSVANQCSGLNFLKVDLVVNPAVDVIFAADELRPPRARLREEGFDARLVTVKNQLGESLPFFDDDGNLFSISQFSEQATTSATGFVGVKLGNLLKRRQSDESRFAAINLMVSDIAKSESFYADILGFERLQGLENTATFDLGTSILNLLPESTPRTVRVLSKTGRLNGDWFVFHTKNITDEIKRLARRGATFPQGVEASAVGEMAYFNDPDGYSLVLWQPPADETLPMKKINFFPALNRILSEVA